MASPALDRSRGEPSLRVSLFITCLVDLLFPRVGEATARLLRRLGVDVDFPSGQTCCGQPAFNAGHRCDARALALHFLQEFESSELIVSPSGSCVTMVREHYPRLLENDPPLAGRVRAVGERTWELSQFLTDVLGMEKLPGRCPRRVTWHDSCHSLRGLGVKEGPRRLLRSLEDIEYRELERAEECCGFGGLFSVKHEEIASAMLADKIESLERSGADCVVATDTSCLMHIEGGLRRRGSSIQTAHLAEVLWEAVEAGSGEPGGD